MIWLRGAFAIAAKEFRHMSHDRITLLITLALPVFQLILFGYALETHIRDVPAAVLNLDPHSGGRTFVSRLSESGLFSATLVSSRAEMQRLLQTGAMQIGIEIPRDFTENALYQRKSTLRVWIDGTNPATADYLLIAADELRLQQSLERTVQQQVPPRSVADIAIHPHVLFNPDRRMAAFLIPGLVAVLMQMVTTLITAISIVRERENGTLDQILVTAAGPNSILAGKLAAFACIGFAEGCVVLILMRYVFHIVIAGNVLLLPLVLILILLPSLGIGLLISARAKHQAQALQLVYTIFLPSVLLSGYLYPLEFMPIPVQWISTFIPTTYFVHLMRAIVLRGAGITGILGDLVASLVMTALLLGLAVRIFNRRCQAQ